MGQCIFCGGGNSKEHIIAKWMLRDCALDQANLGFGVENLQGDMETTSQQQRLRNFCTMEVCEDCNNGWMSQLENKMKSLIHPFIQTTWPANDVELFQSLFIHSDVIARWLLKTASTFGAKMSVEIPETIRTSLYQGVIPVGITADLAYNKQFGLYMAMSRQWSVWKDEKLSTIQINKTSFRLTWQVRHLVMRICYFPQCEKRVKEPRSPVRIYPRFGILPDYQENGVRQRSFHYENLEQLEHDTMYFYQGVDDPTHPNSQHRYLFDKQ